MGWSAIIAALLQLFGPVLVDLLKQLLDKWLNKAAESLPPPDPKDPGAVTALFDAAIDRAPRFAFVRRGFLRSCKRAAEWRANEVMAAASVGGTMTPLGEEEAAELRDAAGAVDAELVG